ncbi:MAG: hypothetical protein M3P70_16550, partial [Actinomycetota bacterium]|nr:hypothetical protein [Actinomycetota bacterium]
MSDVTPTRPTEPAKNARRISVRTATWLAWSLWAACVVLIMLALVLDFMTEEVPFYVGLRFPPGFAVPMGVLSLAYPAVGALIASRLPANPIGWIFCGLGLIYAMLRFTGAYADYALLESFGWPGGKSAAWFSTWIGFAASPALGVFLMLLFPGGRLPSRRWRILRWVTVVGAGMTALGFAFMPGELLNHRYVVNPFGIVGVIGPMVTTYELFGASRVLGMALLLASLLAALLSVLLRLRHARGDERQQLKWFLYAAVPLTVLGSLDGLDVMVAYATTDFMFMFPQPVYMLHSLGLFPSIVYAEVSASLLVPVCTYIAILRYNLYDIDVVINRTL